MRLPLDNEHRIASDAHAWMVQRRTTRKHRQTGEPIDEWETLGWYTTLEQACHSFAQRRLRLSDAESVAQAVSELRRTVADLTQAFSPEFKITAR